MSAARLREAARLMRDRAEDVRSYSDAKTGRPLAWKSNADGQVHGEGGDWQGDLASPLTGLYVASWHPAVALAVADLLDSEADVDDYARSIGGRGLTERSHAVIVADAYLGDPA